MYGGVLCFGNWNSTVMGPTLYVCEFNSCKNTHTYIVGAVKLFCETFGDMCRDSEYSLRIIF